MRMKFAQEAHLEFIAVTRRYAREAGTKLARAFSTDLHNVTTLIATHPDMGAQTVSGCRYFVMDRFPYSIVYRHTEDTVTIIAIAHHSRRPGYWESRTLLIS